MLSRRICFQCNMGRNVYVVSSDTKSNDITAWSCPHTPSQDCRLRTMFDEDSEPPKSCPFKLEHLMEEQNAEA